MLRSARRLRCSMRAGHHLAALLGLHRTLLCLSLLLGLHLHGRPLLSLLLGLHRALLSLSLLLGLRLHGRPLLSLLLGLHRTLLRLSLLCGLCLHGCALLGRALLLRLKRSGLLRTLLCSPLRCCLSRSLGGSALRSLRRHAWASRDRAVRLGDAGRCGETLRGGGRQGARHRQGLHAGRHGGRRTAPRHRQVRLRQRPGAQLAGPGRQCRLPAGLKRGH